MNDLAAVRQAFAAAESLPLGQAWLPHQQTNLDPGSVRLGWQEGSLLILAELSDQDIFTTATKANEHLWELGDTFEIFLRPEDQSAYWELQVAPNNQTLQLRFCDARAVGQLRATGNLQPYLVASSVFHSRTWASVAEGQWFAFAAVTAGAICGELASLIGSRWQVSFGRYDFTRGESDPVISSTSPHARLDFHRQHEWRTLQFEPGFQRK
jgi:hypothetical protein